MLLHAFWTPEDSVECRYSFMLCSVVKCVDCLLTYAELDPSKLNNVLKMFLRNVYSSEKFSSFHFNVKYECFLNFHFPKQCN